MTFNPFLWSNHETRISNRFDLVSLTIKSWIALYLEDLKLMVCEYDL